MPSSDDSKDDPNGETASFQPSGPLDTSTSLPHNPGSRTPSTLGRFRVDNLLGRGGFGEVYRAFDTELQRTVAIKLIFRESMASWNQVEFLKEARILASLDHPHIVPIYEVGQSPDGDHFLVSKLIDGSDLSTRIKEDRIDRTMALGIVETIANALHHAHTKGLIHRDVKPANILLDRSGKPYLADFGIALREVDLGGQVQNSGTPAYMSPEQARGESHRVDHRSDIYSLGVVLYELLTGRRPFRTEDTMQLLSRIATEDVRTPRMFDHSIPSDLERICLKALSRRATDRYQVAKDLAEEIRWLLDQKATENSEPEKSRAAGTASPAIATPSSSELARSMSDSLRTGPTRVVPKGLRSFDAKDSDFFLELLPGPRDRDHLPDSIRFWKSRIEEIDPQQCFLVGLIYGPSGCGKSSLIKAGLLPRLSPRILPVYVEATATDTEQRVTRGVKAAIPDAQGKTLYELLASIRRHRLLPSGGKLLLVLDQFEQWLHSESDYAKASLTEALRQCDGVHIQAIVMVRDDFWLSVSRFLRELEVPIVEGENSGLVDLFDKDHATKVLGLFGKAFGKLPDSSAEWTEDQKVFLTHAVAGLSQAGKVISVRLAVFADMMKSRDWTTAALKEVGGIDGIGVTFLEETFGSHAPPEHRAHREAVRGLLTALLPSAGTDIKGNMRSLGKLQVAAGYENKRREFDELVLLLDRRLRLITPVDTEPQSPTATTPDSALSTNMRSETRLAIAAQEYQLTHDYMVPSLRDWLTRKQRETRKGRAELKLAERSSLWNAKPENRYLPSLTEWLSIRTLTESKHWTAPQRQVMTRAKLVHSLRSGVAASILMAIVFTGFFVRGQVLLRQEATRIEGLVETLLRAEPAQISLIVKELDGNQSVAAALLAPVVSVDAKTVNEKRSQLHARLAMVSYDKSLVEPLLEDLLTNKVTYIGPIRQQLRPYAGQLTEKLRTILRDDKADNNRRFHAATALAHFVPESESASWTDADLQYVAQQLLLANSEFQPVLRENLRPISKRLLPDLEKIFGDSKSTDAQRLSAANAFVDYAQEDFPLLSRLISVATPEQYAVLYPLVASARNSQLKEGLIRLARETPNDDLSTSERVALGKRRAGAAITLLRQGEQENIFEALRFATDPEALSQFVARCRTRGVTAVELLECLDHCDAGRLKITGEARKTEDRVLFGLILALGDYSLDELPESVKPRITERLVNWYAADPSSAIHGATRWLLGRWNKETEVTRIDETPVPYDPTGAREWYVLKINVDESLKDEEQSDADTKDLFFTMIVFPAGEYTIGSSDSGFDRQRDENQHRIRLSRPIAVCDQELTWRNYDPIDQGENRLKWQQKFGQTLSATDPAFGVNWYDAIEYCRWLSTKLGIEVSNQCYENPENIPKDDEGNVMYEKLNLNGQGFRLPTESEWEVICRGDSQTAFSFGNDVNLLSDYSWYLYNSDKWSHPVGKLRPSIRGLFDLHGNMFEWCHDRYGAYNLDSVDEDPLGSLTGTVRVFRGGSWNLDDGYCQSANRGRFNPSLISHYIGVRVVQSLSVKSPETEGNSENK